jgi:hypothetical protein
MTHIWIVLALSAAAADDRRDAAAREAQKTAAYETAASPANASLAAAPGSVDDKDARVGQVIFEGTSKDKVGTASLDWKSGTSSFRFKASGPIDEKTSEAVPLTLEGFSNKASLELAYSKLSWGKVPARDIVEAKAICRRVGLSFDKGECFEDDIRQRSADDADAFRDYLHLDDPLWFWGGSLSGARGAFKWSESISAESQKASHNDWAVVARAGLFTTSFGFVIASYTYEKAFTGKDAQQICAPVAAGASSLKCQSVVVGAPTEGTAKIIRLESRRLLSSGVAINPFFQYDTVTKRKSVVVPVYFLRGDKGPTGGVRGGWRSDTKEVSISVFIGAAFSLTPQ